MATAISMQYSRYQNLPPTNRIWDQDSLLRVEELAAHLNETEILDYFALTAEDLNDAERAVMRTAIRRGTAMAKARMGDKLVSACSDRNGGLLALKYLRMFADKYPAEDIPGLSSGGGFSLKIVADDEY